MMTLREKIIFILAVEWAHAEQKAAPEISLQEIKTKIGEQFLTPHLDAGLSKQTMIQTYNNVQRDITPDIEKACKQFRRKVVGIKLFK